ncbi:GNAT family N-acetyltransferase [Vagococcus silagei]|uniref:GNAT family N-acetyltransferase n=1 Tax=Vagococcus silagei TaxID=2508885 RepID=UPI00109C36D7|nr:GNAT family N-acetyltransferase [Vagococcus silagei]
MTEAQEDFVASTMYSLAEAKIFTENQPFAIYDEEQMVGFIMYSLDPDDNQYWVTRLLIDEKFQQKGYCSLAMKNILKLIKNEFNPKCVYTSFEPENKVAEKLYLKLGFLHTGRIIDDDELVLEYIY